MTDNVKAFLVKKFEDGARTGNKADPVQVAKEMKTLRNEDGHLTFKEPVSPKALCALVFLF